MKHTWQRTIETAGRTFMATAHLSAAPGYWWMLVRDHPQGRVWDYRPQRPWELTRAAEEAAEQLAAKLAALEAADAAAAADTALTCTPTPTILHCCTGHGFHGHFRMYVFAPAGGGPLAAGQARLARSTACPWAGCCCGGLSRIQWDAAAARILPDPEEPGQLLLIPARS